MTLIVRRLRVVDLPALEQIETRKMQRLPTRSGWLVATRNLLERTLAEEPEGVMIADLDGRVVGAAVARQRDHHPLHGVKYGHILHLSVDPGIADPQVKVRLLRECEAYLRSRGCEIVQLWLPADDTSDAEIFNKSGYRVAAWQLERAFR